MGHRKGISKFLNRSASRETFKSILKCPQGQINVNMRTRIVNTLKEQHIPFLEAIPEEQIHILARECAVEAFNPGEVS